MAGDSYKPDKSGILKVKPGEIHRTGFDLKFDPTYGSSVTIELPQSVRDQLDPDARSKFVGISREDTNAEGTAALVIHGDAALGELDISAWRWDGLTLQMPTTLQVGADALSSVLSTIADFLNLLQGVLTLALKVVTAGSDDLLATVFALTKAKIDEILGLFAGKTGIYLINIPVQIPPGKAMKEKMALLTDIADSLALSGDTGVAGFIPTNAMKTPTDGGMTGFITAVERSMEDTKDVNRPQFGSSAWVGGLSLVYGGSDFTRILDAIRDLEELFGDLFQSSDRQMSPKPPVGVTVKTLDSSKAGSTPQALVRWQPPRELAIFNLRSKDSSSPTVKWVAVMDTVYRIPNLFSMTRRELDALPYEMDARALLKGVRADDAFKLAEEIHGATLGSGVSLAVPSFTHHLDKGLTASDVGRTYIYKVGRTWAFHAYDSSTGTYVDQETDITLFSTNTFLNVPKDLGETSGTPPDWSKLASLEALFPAVCDLLQEFRLIYDDLTGMVTSRADGLELLLAGMVEEISKWSVLANRINLHVQNLKSLLSPKVGIHMLSFFGKGGNTFVTDVMKKSVELGPAVPDPTPNVESWDDAQNALDLYDWGSASTFPDFADTDLVGGLVLLAGDESAEAVRQVLGLLAMLFGDGVVTEITTRSKAETALGPVPALDGTQSFDSVFGAETTALSSKMFDDAFKPLAASDHDQRSEECV
jgi:hypothetical protein